jgi:hypothetical protein
MSKLTSLAVHHTCDIDRTPQLCSIDRSSSRLKLLVADASVLFDAEVADDLDDEGAAGALEVACCVEMAAALLFSGELISAITT